MLSVPGPGRFGCPLGCDQPPPHEHLLPVILNARYFCPDASEHEWGAPSRWLKRVRCARCGYRKRTS